MKILYYEEIVAHIQQLHHVWNSKYLIFRILFCYFLVSGGQSQTYSDLSISSLRPSESLNSVVNPYQQQSPITNLDETVKSTPLKPLHVAREIVERYDEGVFDDGGGSQTEEDENMAVSDDEDEIAHFDSNDDNNQRNYLTNTKDNQNNTSIEAKTDSLGN